MMDHSTKPLSLPHGTCGRRTFVSTLTKAVGSSFFLLSPKWEFAEPSGQISPAAPTVQEVIDLILRTIPGAPFRETVDTLKSGSAQQRVEGIVTTTFPTLEVIQKTIALKANFIIVHEPSYYSHTDATDWLENSDVYRHKADLLKKNGIAVWRFHDYWHSHRPDGVMTGVLKTIGWEKYANQENPRLITLPSTPLSEIAAHLKNKLGIPMLRTIGKPEQQCQRIVLSPGAADGKAQMAAIQKENPDLFICGELREWETAEYIRDARQMGKNTALIVLGHAVSEEPGMQYLVSWLQPKVPGTKVTHIPARNPFNWV